MDYSGTIDLKSDEAAVMDIIVLGYHKFVKASSVRGFFGFNLPNFFLGLFGSEGAKRKTKNTDAFIKAMQRYPVAIISHPALGFNIDLPELAKAAAHYGVLLELNGKRVAFDKSAAHKILNAGADFIMDSDAHSPARIGEVSTPTAFAKQAEIPFDRIANWEKIPTLRSAFKVK
jgi:putative hydrolase